VAALAGGLALSGCGGSTHGSTSTEPNGAPAPSAEVARARLETYIASDIRDRAIAAKSGSTVTVESVRCVRRDRIHYVCRIRSSSSYRKGVDEFVADAFYDPRTEQAGYDIRP
jgi:hypothetical protein